MITLDQAKSLSYDDTVWTISTNPRKANKVRRLKINGAPKLWKRQPDVIRIPWKYGLYEYGYLHETDLDDVYMTEAECRAAFAAQTAVKA